ncbi:HD-GYP domain-containing protein [Variovorax sp. N23]|uniref:HD-GYP domain-containing protein n=1 Tax=Variovorax sp. N23 TaxID=2980555 RepID=UPI0021CA62CF|nr:HD-GYP domain-containing protein [Variovorax sp. N23]MCU4120264.1 HD-GYP domain-containing protein [Variovorax sp. N23]
MLKKIKAADLQEGMVLKGLDGVWTGVPTSRWTSRVLDKRLLRSLRARGDVSVWIEVPEAPPVVRTPTPGPVEAHEAALNARNLGASTMKGAFADVQANRPLNVSLAIQVVDGIYASIEHDPGAMLSVARLKTADEYTYMHCVAVCALMAAFARELGMTEGQCRNAAIGGLFHDLGKARVPIEILNKPGALTDAEFTTMKDHPRLGTEMLVHNGFDEPIALDICLHHHEKISGGGYPDGLDDDGISIYARMAAICDVFDAVTSARVYKSAWDPADALVRMAAWKGHFDRDLLATFIKLVGVYPVGSLVRLSSGLLAVVVQQRKDRLYTPVVRTFYSTIQETPTVPTLLDLSEPDCDVQIVGREPRDLWDDAHIQRLSLPG